MSPAQRLRLLGALVAVAETGLGLLLMGTVLAPYFWVTAALTLAVTFVAGRFMTPPPEPPEDPGTGDPPEPPWWPEFESALRAHTHGPVHH